MLHFILTSTIHPDAGTDRRAYTHICGQHKGEPFDGFASGDFNYDTQTHFAYRFYNQSDAEAAALALLYIGWPVGMICTEEQWRAWTYDDSSAVSFPSDAGRGH